MHKVVKSLNIGLPTFYACTQIKNFYDLREISVRSPGWTCILLACEDEKKNSGPIYADLRLEK